MTWQPLRAAKRVQPHVTSKQELDALRDVVERDLSDAALPRLSDDRKFATAYNAVLQLSKMAIACAGYRVAARSGHHETTFRALKLAMGKAVAKQATYFNTCRRKRNLVDYDVAHTVSSSEAVELVQKAEEFREMVEK
jgi:hypothetical protein